MNAAGRRDGDDAATRRRFLAAIGGGCLAATGGCLGGVTGGGQSGTAVPDDATFVLSTAQSGQYGDVGDHERRGVELAVAHLNDGGGLVDEAFPELSGDGVLGRTVDATVVDSESDAAATRSAVRPVLGRRSSVVLLGGVAAEVVRVHADLAADEGVPYLAGPCPVEDLAGGACSPVTFRELPHASALVAALGPSLRSEFGDDRAYFQLYADAPEGRDLVSAVTDYFGRSETPNWQPLGSSPVRPGTTDLDAPIRAASGTQPDVVFLNLFGLDAINAVRQVGAALPDVDVVVPLVDSTLEAALGDDVAGVLGTVPWDPSVESERSETFDAAYRERFARGPSRQLRATPGTAHVAYSQTLAYAAAVERAGSFDVEAVGDALEGAEYDTGLGTQRLQACNHQATRPIPVVRGRSIRPSGDDFFEVLTVARDAVPGCSEPPASSCSL